MMPRNVYLRGRRLALGLSDVNLANVLDITVESYDDLEGYADELNTVLPVSRARLLATALNTSLLELYGLPCAFCTEDRPYLDFYLLKRNEIIRQARRNLKLSEAELSGRVGVKVTAIQQLEERPDYIEDWVLDDIFPLAKELSLPLQLALGAKCLKCNR